MNKLLSFAQAVATGKYVSKEIKKQREEECKKCEKKRTDRSGIDFCGMCGCSVSSLSTNIKNLAAYEENLPKWGCKHPLRNRKGFGWTE